MEAEQTSNINEQAIEDIGLTLLNKLKSFKAIKPFSDFLKGYQFNKSYTDDSKIWLTCVLSLKALSDGNFGIGALLTNNEGLILAYGHNEVFHPYFRSDRHAEMVVLNKFEKEYKRIHKTVTFNLYSSLEPCPMCLTRLITSGIGIVKYASSDPTGGMAHTPGNLPELWQQLAARRIFTTALCSTELSMLAQNIFMMNAADLNKKLRERGTS